MSRGVKCWNLSETWSKKTFKRTVRMPSQRQGCVGNQDTEVSSTQGMIQFLELQKMTMLWLTTVGVSLGKMDFFLCFSCFWLMWLSNTSEFGVKTSTKGPKKLVHLTFTPTKQCDHDLGKRCEGSTPKTRMFKTLWCNFWVSLGLCLNSMEG